MSQRLQKRSLSTKKNSSFLRSDISDILGSSINSKKKSKYLNDPARGRRPKLVKGKPKTKARKTSVDIQRRERRESQKRKFSVDERTMKNNDSKRSIGILLL